MTISTRPSVPTVSAAPTIPSAHAIGDTIIFVPAAQIPHIILAQGVACKVVGITFEESKVLYDLALPIGAFAYYEEYPLLRVDSIFVFPQP